MARRIPDIVQFATDPDLLNLALSPAQETLLRAIYGLPLADAHHELFRACTGRHTAPTASFAEATVISRAPARVRTAGLPRRSSATRPSSADTSATSPEASGA